MSLWYDLRDRDIFTKNILTTMHTSAIIGDVVEAEYPLSPDHPGRVHQCLHILSLRIY